MTFFNSSCKCANKSECVDCKCGCDPATCCKGTDVSSGSSKCPFLAAHPNWRKCPFMSQMFGLRTSDSGTKNTDVPMTTNPDVADTTTGHEQCDTSKCAKLPDVKCTSCHNTGLNHTITLQSDTEFATDLSEETTL